MDEFELPVFFVRDGTLFASTEVIIKKYPDGYSGFIAVDGEFGPSDGVVGEDNITIALQLVYGSNGERVPIGTVKLRRMHGYYGGFINLALSLEEAVSTARSLTNQVV